MNNANGSAPDHDGVDAPATLDRALSGTRGTVTLDALSLGLATSLDYDVRTGSRPGRAISATLDGAIERSIQFDPAARTGWTYSPDGTQIQQFSY